MKINRLKFIEAQKEFWKKPMRYTEDLDKKVFSRRDYRLAIRLAAAELLEIIITYTKTTTGDTNKYHVDPYSYRYRHTRNGLRKLLFAEDVKEHKIKGFVMRMISSAELTDRHFTPRWQIEID